ncbi:MAG: chemotaxis protein CheW [Ignavibacteriaceae bacterium]
MIDPLSLVETLTGLVIFEIKQTEFCIDIKDVSAIINPNELEESSIINPESTKEIKVDKLIIPILDLQKFNGLGALALNKDTRILILEFINKKVGFFVDRVKEIITIDIEFRTNSLKFLPEKDDTYLMGMLKYEDRQLSFPNFLDSKRNSDKKDAINTNTDEDNNRNIRNK